MKKNEAGNILIVAAVMGAFAAGAVFFAYNVFGPKNNERNFVLPTENGAISENENSETETPPQDNLVDENAATQEPSMDPTVKLPDNKKEPKASASEFPESPEANNPYEFIDYAVGADPTAATAASNKFGMDLYAKYRAKSDNIFFAPYSIFSALGMTYEGAKGATASEIATVFNFSTDSETRVGSFAKLYRQINPQNASYQLSTANALWVQKSYPFRADYLKTVETYYGGKAANADFAGDAEGSRQMINKWVSSETNDKIPDLFAKGSLDQFTRMVLTNAVYFKGKWAIPFDKTFTQEKEFTTRAQTKVKAQMMSQTNSFSYGETDDYQAIEIPYEKNDLSMVVILPKEDKNEAAESTIIEKGIAKIKETMSTEKVKISLPKLKFDTSYNMNQTLEEMGMSTAFNPVKSDFTGLYDREAAFGDNLYIALVIHKAFVDVSEEGTEATASTGVVISKATGVMEPETPKEFSANRPFTFAIVHNQTGTILFMGKVNDPSK